MVAPAGDSAKHSDNFCECVADSFAFIRFHTQYSKQDAQNALNATAWISTQNFILYNETLHFTAPVLKELGGFLKDNDVAKLTPIETSNMAYRAALKYSFPEEKINKLSKVFAPVRDAYKEDRALSLKLCAELMLQDHGDLSNEVFAIGKIYLEPFLNKNMQILNTRCSKKEIAGLKFEGEVWNKVSPLILAGNSAKPLNDSLDYLELCGAFDRNKADMINPANYETKTNLNNIKRAKNAYINKGF